MNTNPRWVRIICAMAMAGITSACSNGGVPTTGAFLFDVRADAAGTVVGPTGGPLEQVLVRLRLPKAVENEGYVSGTATTDAAGRFQVSIQRLGSSQIPVRDTISAYVVATASGAKYTPRADGTYITDSTKVLLRFIELNAKVLVVETVVRMNIAP